MKKPKKPTPRNPIAKALRNKNLRQKVKPDKKKRNLPDGGLSYNKQPLFDGI